MPVFSKLLFKVLAGMSLVVTLTVAAAALLIPRLLDIEAYRPQILSAARNSLHRPFSYDTAELSFQPGLSIVVRGITVGEKSGDAVFLKVDRATFTLALLPLLHKEIRLSKLLAEQPQIVLDRDRTGAFNVDDLFTGSTSAYSVTLDEVRVQNGLIRFTDRLAEPAGWSTSLENLDLDVHGLRRGARSAFKLTLKMPEGERRAALSLSGIVTIPAAGKPLATTAMDIKLSATGLNADRFRPYYGRHVPFERLSGTIDVEQEFKGSPAEFTTQGKLRISELRLSYPRAFTAPLSPRNIQLTYGLERTSRDLSLKSFDLDVDGLRVKGSCALGDIGSTDMHIMARGSSSPFRLEDFNRYIPYGIIPTGTGNFIRNHITGGLFRLEEGRLDGRISQIAHMEHGDNSKALFIRGSVEQGLVSFGPQVPAFSDIKGRLEMQGRDFSLRGMTGRFGTSPFSLDGRIADYPLQTPASYPFSMTVTPSKTEIDWLLRQKDSAALSFSGPSTLNLAGAGTAADYRLSGTWDLTRSEYRYRDMLNKPAGLPNRLQFAGRLGDTRAELTDFRYLLPPLGVSASASYRYQDSDPLTFTLSTNRFALTRDLPYVPGLQKYQPAGSLQARLSGSGNPSLPGGIRLNGDVTLTEVSLRPLTQVRPVSGLSGTIHLTETRLEAQQLTGRIGNSPFTAAGSVTGRIDPAVELTFSAPVLHPEDFCLVSSGHPPEVNGLAGAVHLKGGTLTITSLTGQTAATKFRVNGELYDIDNPRLDLRVDFPNLRVEDLLPLAGLKRAGNQSPPSGPIALKARITSAAGSFREIPFQQLETQLTLNERLLAVTSLNVGLFDGVVSASGQADFSADTRPVYQASYRLNQVDAVRLLRAAGEKPYLSGLVSVHGELNARGNSWQELLKSARATAGLHLQKGEVSLSAPGEGPGKQVAYTELDADLAYAAETLTVNGLKAGVFGGILTSSGRAEFAATDGPAYRASYRLERGAAEQLLRAAGANPYLTGQLSAEGEMTARGNTHERLRESGQMTATILLNDGVLNTPAVTGSRDSAEFHFNKFQTRLTLAGKRLALDEIAMDVFGGAVTGDFGADFGATDGPAYRVRYHLANIDANELFHAFDVTKELSGRLTMQAGLSARGDDSTALSQSLKGELTLHMEKGTIKKYGFVTSIFSILNVSQIVDFRVPNLSISGMPYDSIDGTMVFADGIVTTSDLSIHSPSLNMTMVGSSDLVKREIDMKIGVQPFQSFGRFVGRIPVIGWILTGGKKRVVVVYYEAKGKWGDPKISGTSMSSLPGGVYNIFKRVYGLPEELISQPGEVILGN